MADAYIGNRAKRLNVSPEFTGYSRVVIYTGQEDDEGNPVCYSAGEVSGRTLEITNPWASQVMANNVLAKIRGWVYQPYEAEGARLSPAAEIGDSVTVSDIFSGIYSRNLNFTSLYKPNLSAPYDEEIDHEYGYESSTNRQYIRQFQEMSASLMFFSNEITAKVSKEGGSGSSFSWSLKDNKWSVFAGNKEVFKVDANGAVVEGTIRASNGMIGGFNIGQNALYNNISSFGGSQATGVYLGNNGIQCGQGFRVDSAGNLFASSGTFSGNVYAKNIQYGGSYGTFSGAGISGGSIGTGHFVSGVNTSLGFADFSNDVFNKRDIAEYCYAKYLLARNDVTAPTYYVDYGSGQRGSVNTHTHYVTVSGNKVTIGAPDFSGTPHPFEIASPNVTISQNGQATYQSGYRRYAVPIVARDETGKTVASATIYVSASQAYDAGYSAGQSSVDATIYDGGSADYGGWYYQSFYTSSDSVRVRSRSAIEIY